MNIDPKYLWSHKDIKSAQWCEHPDYFNSDFDNEYEVKCLNPKENNESKRIYIVNRRGFDNLIVCPTWYPDKS